MSAKKEKNKAKNSEEETTQAFEDLTLPLEYRIEIATQTLDRNIGFINNCDNKASIILAAIGLFLTVILTDDSKKSILTIIKNNVKTLAFFDILYLLILLVSVIIMSYGICCLVRVLFANTSEKLSDIESGDCLIFFGGIAGKDDSTYSKYNSNFREMNKENLLNALIIEIYINAFIATQKYKKYNMGIKCSMLGFIMFIIILFVGFCFY